MYAILGFPCLFANERLILTSENEGSHLCIDQYTKFGPIVAHSEMSLFVSHGGQMLQKHDHADQPSLCTRLEQNTGYHRSCSLY